MARSERSRFLRAAAEAQRDFNVKETVLQVLHDQGLGNIGEAVRILLDEAMRIERFKVLESDPYERCEKRRGYANDFKPKTIDTRIGEMKSTFRRFVMESILSVGAGTRCSK